MRGWVRDTVGFIRGIAGTLVGRRGFDGCCGGASGVEDGL